MRYINRENLFMLLACRRMGMIIIPLTSFSSSLYNYLKLICCIRYSYKGNIRFKDNWRIAIMCCHVSFCCRFDPVKSVAIVFGWSLFTSDSKSVRWATLSSASDFRVSRINNSSSSSIGSSIFAPIKEFGMLTARAFTQSFILAEVCSLLSSAVFEQRWLKQLLTTADLSIVRDCDLCISQAVRPSFAAIKCAEAAARGLCVSEWWTAPSNLSTDFFY